MKERKKTSFGASLIIACALCTTTTSFSVATDHSSVPSRDPGQEIVHILFSYFDNAQKSSLPSIYLRSHYLSRKAAQNNSFFGTPSAIAYHNPDCSQSRWGKVVAYLEVDFTPQTIIMMACELVQLRPQLWDYLINPLSEDPCEVYLEDHSSHTSSTSSPPPSGSMVQQLLQKISIALIGIVIKKHFFLNPRGGIIYCILGIVVEIITNALLTDIISIILTENWKIRYKQSIPLLLCIIILEHILLSKIWALIQTYYIYNIHTLSLTMPTKDMPTTASPTLVIDGKACYQLLSIQYDSPTQTFAITYRSLSDTTHIPYTLLIQPRAVDTSLCTTPQGCFSITPATPHNPSSKKVATYCLQNILSPEESYYLEIPLIDSRGLPDLTSP